jgi:hypothetical protein
MPDTKIWRPFGGSQKPAFLNPLYILFGGTAASEYSGFRTHLAIKSSLPLPPLAF